MTDTVTRRTTTNEYLDKLLTEAKEIEDISIDLLKATVERLVQRGDKLDVLSAKAEDLNQSSVHFHVAARRVPRRMKRQMHKKTLFIIAIVILIVGLLISTIPKPWN